MVLDEVVFKLDLPYHIIRQIYIHLCFVLWNIHSWFLLLKLVTKSWLRSSKLQW